MQILNFPHYEFRLKNSENKLYIFDIIRKKFVKLLPEEWVRQHVVKFLINEKGCPASLISVEKKLLINGLTKRYDVIVYYPNGEIFLIVECKSPQVEITQTVFDQIARYNLSINANNLMISNGLQHFYCQMDYQNKKYIFLKDLPNFFF